METTIYNKEGKQSGKVKLPEQVFGLPWNVDLVKQVVVSMQANARTPVAHTKDRSDVRGGGKKPWRQKGTGRARHGSIRSPLWRGGGVTFGPRNEKNYTKKINKKMRTKALYTALSRKFKEGEILFVDSLAFTAPKTKDAQEILTALSKVSGFEQLVTKKKNAALVTLSERDANVEKSFQNIGQVYVGEVRNLNPVDVLTCKYLIITDPTKSLTLLSSRGTGNEVASETKAEEKKTPAKAKKVPAKTKEKVAAAA